MQTILMMAELEGHSFWNQTTGSPILVEELPLSSDLSNQITEWVEFYDEHTLVNFDKLDSPLHENNFDVLGKQLWSLVKEELVGKYRVKYFSESADEILDA